LKVHKEHYFEGETMKRLFPIFILITTVSMMAFAQDSALPQEPDRPQTGYNYSGRAEVFVTGFGLLPHQTRGNDIGNQATNAGGASAGYRFHLNASSALEGRYGFSRNSQKYTIGGTVSSIPAYLSEISGSYIYNFAKSRSIRPFLEGGGGLLLFSPGNYGGGATPSGASTLASPFGYSVTDPAVNAALPAYGGSSAPARQAKGMLVYGAGVDVPTGSRLYFRLEFRALGYKVPDFGAAALHTDVFTFVYEPSVGVAYRF
jgi:hypothetical protein